MYDPYPQRSVAYRVGEFRIALHKGNSAVIKDKYKSLPDSMKIRLIGGKETPKLKRPNRPAFHKEND